jgi:hypothetical protein
MRKAISRLMIAGAMVAAAWGQACAQGLQQRFDRSNTTLSTASVRYKGRDAVRAVDRSGEQPLNPLLLLPVEGFKDGVIEAEVAGLPAAGAPEGARGFIGIAFRVQRDSSRYEAFYIRPTNGRSDDQLRRNHSTQYTGMPDYPWDRLRKEHPGVYESYADMVPGAWIRLRIEVEGSRARLFVGGAGQPALIVNDLKHGADAIGGVALWVGSGTEGYFSNVRVTKRQD